MLTRKVSWPRLTCLDTAEMPYRDSANADTRRTLLETNHISDLPSRVSALPLQRVCTSFAAAKTFRLPC